MAVATLDRIEPPPTEPPDHDDPDDDGGAGDGDGRPWVTVATFWQPMEAQLARIKLESEAIDCVLLDENLVATDWLYANAVGGIKIQVPAGDVDRARAALARPSERGDAEDDDEDQAPRADGFTSPDAAIKQATGAARCPSCGSLNARRRFATRRSVALAILLLGFPIPFLSRQWTCDDCGHDWT